MNDLRQIDPAKRQWIRKWVVLISAAESLVDSLIKIAAAYYTGSTGLLADCIHSAADVFGSVLVWIGVRISSKPLKAFPYGFYKIENLLALAIGFAILYGAYEILLIFFTGKSELPENIPIGMTAVVLCILLDYFWGRYEARSGRLINSPGIEASGNHTLTDVYSSAIVLVGLAGSYFGYNLDRWAALIIAFIIGKIGLEILWNNIKSLLDIGLPQEKLGDYTKVISRVPGVQTVKTIKGRNSGSFRFVNVHVGLKAFSISSAERIASSIEKALKDFDTNIDTVFVHYNHELPETIKIFIPTDEKGEIISEHFGKSSHLTEVIYHRTDNRVMNKTTIVNPFSSHSEHRGINLADHLINQGVDSVCSREDIGNKGPGLMFFRYGIDVRKTERHMVDELLSGYLTTSESVFPEETLTE